MITRRRLAAGLAAGVLALLGMAGCRSQPGTAAYVGDARFTEAQVEEIVNSIPNLPGDRIGDAREFTVTMLVLREAGTGYANREGLSIPDPQVDAIAEQSGLPADSRYTVLLADFNAVLRALAEHAEPAAPSESDQREAYANLQTNGQPVPPFDQVRQAFSAETMGVAVGQRNLLTGIVRDADVMVNPKYGDLDYQVPLVIGQVQSSLAVRLAEQPGSGPAVVDSSPASEG